tara:strand:- start:767 stop:928 length:162 start_codon:yes stop_codon:yes gene_type:complete
MKQIKNINHSYTLRFKVISENKITYYLRLTHTDDSIGLYDNDFNLVKTIKGEI